MEQKIQKAALQIFDFLGRKEITLREAKIMMKLVFALDDLDRDDLSVKQLDKKIDRIKKLKDSLK